MREKARTIVRHYGGALLLTALAVGLRWLIDPWTGDHFPLSTLYGAVALTVWISGFRPAVVVVLMGYLGSDWMFIEPRASLGFENLRTAIGLLTYLLSCTIIIVFGEAMRTAQHRAETALQRLKQEAARERDAEERFRLAAEAVNGIIYEFDIAAEMVKRTRGLYEVLGYRPDEVPSTLAWWVDQIHPDDRERVTHIDRSGAPVTNVAVEYRVRHKDGRWLHVEDRAVIVRDGAGKPVRIVGCTVDVTDRKQFQEDLRASEERFRALMRASSDALFRMNADWTEMRHLQGRGFISDTHEPSRTWMNRYIHPDDQPHVLEAIQKAVRTRSVFELEHRVVRADGTLGWTFSRAVPLLDSAGQIVEWFGASTDVTVRKRLEWEREQERAILNGLIASAPVGITFFDDQLRYRMVNEPLAEINGISCEAHIGRTVAEVVPDIALQVEPIFKKVMETGKAVTDQIIQGETPKTPGDKRYWRESWFPVPGPCGKPTGVGVIVQDVTDQRRAENELRRRIEEVEALMEFMPIAVIRAEDRECHRLTGNPAAHKLLRIPVAGNLSKTPCPDLPGPPYRVFQNGVEVPADHLPMQTACRDGVEVRDAEYEIVYDGGGSRHIYCYATPLFDGPGTIRGCLFAALDITERKRTEAALRRAEERFRASQEASLFGFTILNAVRNEAGHLVDFEWEYVNPAAAAILKRPAAELVGRRLLEVLPNNRQNSELFDSYVRVVETGRPHDFELHYDGEGINGWFRNMAVKLGDGVAVSFTDMTARRRAEDEVRQRERLLQSVLDYTPAVIFIKDVDGRLLLVNQRFCELAGRPASEIVGRLDREVFPGRTLDDIHANDLRVFAEGRTLEFEEVLNLADGPHTFLAIKVPVEGVGFPGTVLVGITTDISQRKQTEQMLRDADRRKDEFIATLAHELRNPLAPIRSAVQLLKMKGPPDPELIWCRDVIDRQVGQMARLLDDLLDVSRITNSKMELRKCRVTLASVVESAVETSRPLIDAGSHELAVVLPSEPVFLDADPVRLAQVFANLLNNAAKYTDPGGHIRLTAERAGQEVVVSVRDDGMGINREALPGLFRTFSQATPALERAQGGLGIGLSLVKELVEMHGGAVTASSEGPGKGSEFVVRLPVATPATLSEPPSAKTEKASAPGCRILVADDNRDAAESLALLLKITGNEVRTASDGQEAIEVAESFRPDVVLLDIGMPRMNGYEACRRLRQEPWGNDIFIIALTGWGQDDDRRRSQEAGFNSHMVKPVDPAALKELLAARRHR